LLGIFSAPLHPAGARLVGNWISAGGRSQANGMVNGSALIGIAAAPPVFGFMINRFDWPAAFLFASAATALLTLVWMVFASESPAASARAATSLAPGVELETPTTPWLTLFQDRSLLLLTLSYGMVGYFQYLFFYWMTYYFQKVLLLEESKSQYYAAIPALAMAIGMPAGGWLSDRLVAAVGPRWGRRLVPMGGMAAGALFLGLGVLARQPDWIVAWFSLALGAVGAAEGPFWATAVELGRRRGGSAAGLLNTGGNAGGLLAPIVTPWVGQRFGWGAAVALGSLVSLIGLTLWLGIEPARALDDRKKPTEILESDLGLRT
jgi:MFS family permease